MKQKADAHFTGHTDESDCINNITSRFLIFLHKESNKINSMMYPMLSIIQQKNNNLQFYICPHKPSKKILFTKVRTKLPMHNEGDRNQDSL